MTKYEWDSRLRKALKDLPADERKRVFEYYDELFEDRMDGGAKEEAIVRAFGEPEAAAKKILADYHAYLDRDERQAVEETASEKTADNRKGEKVDSDPDEKADLRPNETSKGRGFCDEIDRGGSPNDPLPKQIAAQRDNPPAEDVFDLPCETREPNANEAASGRYRGVRKLKINVCVSDVTVKRGEGCDVKTRDDEESLFEITLSGDTLYVKEKAASFWKNISLLFGSKEKKVEIELPELESITFDSMKRGCEVDGFDLRRATLKTVSGNLAVVNCNSEYMSLTTTSGEISVTDGRHYSAALSTTSGDIHAARLSGDSLTAVSVGGDVNAENCDFPEKMLLKTVGGDVSGIRANSKNFECKTIGGDMEISLVGEEKDYTVFARSVTGSIRSPRGGDGEKRVAVSSVSGDINLIIGNR